MIKPKYVCDRCLKEHELDVSKLKDKQRYISPKSCSEGDYHLHHYYWFECDCGRAIGVNDKQVLNDDSIEKDYTPHVGVSFKHNIVEMSVIDKKIQELRGITNEFIFIEHYSHTDGDMYKIFNEFTNYGSYKVALCRVTDGIEKALDLAIKHISEYKKDFFK